jgi:hypothetical protein
MFNYYDRSLNGDTASDCIFLIAGPTNLPAVCMMHNSYLTFNQNNVIGGTTLRFSKIVSVYDQYYNLKWEILNPRFPN